MRNPTTTPSAATCLLVVYVFLLILAPLFPSFPEDMVPIFLFLALLAVVAQFVAITQPLRRAALMCAIGALVLSAVMWFQGRAHLEQRANKWQEQAFRLMPTTTAPASMPTTHP